MSALEVCDEAKPMGPDIDKDPRNYCSAHSCAVHVALSVKCG